MTNPVIISFPLVLVVSIVAIDIEMHQAYAAESAYGRGQPDAVRDYHGLNGHGYVHKTRQHIFSLLLL